METCSHGGGTGSTKQQGFQMRQVPGRMEIQMDQNFISKKVSLKFCFGQDTGRTTLRNPLQRKKTLEVEDAVLYDPFICNVDMFHCNMTVLGDSTKLIFDSCCYSMELVAFQLEEFAKNRSFK